MHRSNARKKGYPGLTPEIVKSKLAESYYSRGGIYYATLYDEVGSFPYTSDLIEQGLTHPYDQVRLGFAKNPHIVIQRQKCIRGLSDENREVVTAMALRKELHLTEDLVNRHIDRHNKAAIEGFLRRDDAKFCSATLTRIMGMGSDMCGEVIDRSNIYLRHEHCEHILKRETSMLVLRLLRRPGLTPDDKLMRLIEQRVGGADVKSQIALDILAEVERLRCVNAAMNASSMMSSASIETQDSTVTRRRL